MKYLKFTLLMFAFMGGILFLLQDLMSLKGEYGALNNITFERAIKTFILALLSSLFSILTLGSNNLLKEDKKTIEDKLYKLSLSTEFNFLLIFLYWYPLLALLTIISLFFNFNWLITYTNISVGILNILFGIIAFLLIRKNFLMVQFIKFVNNFINK